MTAYEKRMFLESALPMVSETGVELVGRWLIENTGVRERPGHPGLAPVLDALLEGRGRPYIRVFTALGELVRRECLPVLVLSPASQDLSRLQGIARLLAELAAAQPGAALIVVVEPELFDDYLEQSPVCCAKALLREAVVTINHESRGVGYDARDAPVAESRAPAILDRESDDDDPARSAAERFLFERLESSPETAGLFELNGTLDFRFGPTQWIEVDLVARSLKLAVEVDGYHHFQDPEAYRRDRRKDLELQKHGYLVVRVLADDVVERCEDVMEHDPGGGRVSPRGVDRPGGKSHDDDHDESLRYRLPGSDENADRGGKGRTRLEDQEGPRAACWRTDGRARH